MKKGGRNDFPRVWASINIVAVHERFSISSYKLFLSLFSVSFSLFVVVHSYWTIHSVFNTLSGSLIFLPLIVSFQISFPYLGFSIFSNTSLLFKQRPYPAFNTSLLIFFCTSILIAFFHFRGCESKEPGKRGDDTHLRFTLFFICTPLYFQPFLSCEICSTYNCIATLVPK